MNYRLTTCICVLAPLYAGAPGDLDATFNQPKGYVLTSVAPNTAQGAGQILVQSDGKLVVAGLTNANGPGSVIFLARYNTNGTLDNSYGSGGIKTQAIGSISGALGALQQASGKIVTTGYAKDTDLVYKCAVARFGTTGSLDTTFGSSGYTLTQIGAESAGWKIKAQSNGKLVATGYYLTEDEDYWGIAAARYSADGAIDTAFGNATPTDGTFTWPTPETTQDTDAMDIAIQSDNKIVLAGYFDATSTKHYFQVVRLTADGALDTDFGNGLYDSPDGFSRTSFGGTSTQGSDWAACVGLQSTGKIIAAGYSNPGFNTSATHAYIALVRYNTDGTEDTSFGSSGTGKVITSLLKNAAAISLLINSDDKIILGGLAQTSSDEVVCFVARYTASGILDTTFGTNGITVTDIPESSYETILSLAQQSDGKIVATGGSSSYQPFVRSPGGPWARRFVHKLFEQWDIREGLLGYRDVPTSEVIVLRYLNEATTISATQLARAQQLANTWGLGRWVPTAHLFFDMMQYKGNDFGATHYRSTTTLPVCDCCS